MSAPKGGDTPPQIATGSFVSWDGGKGRVDLVVTTGKVPGVADDVEATTDSPAARIVVWRDGKATGDKVAASTHTLKRIPPLDGADEGKTGLVAVIGLQTKHAEYVTEAGLPASANVTATAAATAYSRGYASWPGESKTALAPDEWAIGRLVHLFKVALLDEVQTNDPDLLHPEHALSEIEDSALQDQFVLGDHDDPVLTGDTSDYDGLDSDTDDGTVTLPITLDEVRAAADDPEAAADLASRLTLTPPPEPAGEPADDTVALDPAALQAEMDKIEADTP